MANDLNQCNFIGRLGKPPEVRYSSSGDAITNFSIAIGSQWKDKSGEKQESTEWINCVAFGKLGEIVGQYLVKGSHVYVSGRMKTEKYQGKDGQDRYSTKIIASEMKMLGSKSQEATSHEPESKPDNSKAGNGFADMDDDIPF